MKESKFIEKAAHWIGEHGWQGVTTEMLAKALQVDAKTIAAEIGVPYGLVSALNKMVTKKAIQDAETGDDQSIRDRLFDVLMERFDVLEEYKPFFRQTRKAMIADPVLAGVVAVSVQCSSTQILSAVGVLKGTPLDLLRIKGFAAAYLSVARIWLEDESEDLAATMAAVDRMLERIGGAASFLDKIDGKRPTKMDEEQYQSQD